MKKIKEQFPKLKEIRDTMEEEGYEKLVEQLDMVIYDLMSEVRRIEYTLKDVKDKLERTLGGNTEKTINDLQRMRNSIKAYKTHNFSGDISSCKLVETSDDLEKILISLGYKFIKTNNRSKRDRNSGLDNAVDERQNDELVSDVTFKDYKMINYFYIRSNDETPSMKIIISSAKNIVFDEIGEFRKTTKVIAGDFELTSDNYELNEKMKNAIIEDLHYDVNEHEFYYPYTKYAVYLSSGNIYLVEKVLEHIFKSAGIENVEIVKTSLPKITTNVDSYATPTKEVKLSVLIKYKNIEVPILMKIPFSLNLHENTKISSNLNDNEESYLCLTLENLKQVLLDAIVE
jgi:hypothetical protein